MLRLQFFELASEVRADGVRIFEQILFFDEVDGCFCRDAGNWIASESGNVEALKTGGNLWCGNGQTYGCAVGQSLRAGQNVRRHLPLLDAEPFLPGTAPAGLHFVADEESAVLLDDFENDLEIFLGRRDEAADPLDRFGDEGGDVSAGAGLNEIFDVVRARYFAGRIGQMQRATVTIRIHGVRNAYANHAALAIRRVGGYGFGDRGTACICVTEGHYVVAAGGHARDQDRCLVRFRSRTREKTLLQISRGNLCDFLSQSYDVFVRIERGRVLQAVHLGIDLAGDLGIAVADGNGQDAAEEIQILAAFQIPEILHLATIGHQRSLIVIGYRGPQIFFVLGDYLIATRRGGHGLGRSSHVLVLTSSVECIEFSGNRSRASNAIVAA